MTRRSSRKLPSTKCLVAAVACSLAAASTAFIVNPSLIRVATAAAELRVTRAGQPGTRAQLAREAEAVGSTAWPTVACATLLLASSLQALYKKNQRSAPKARVVACQAVPAVHCVAPIAAPASFEEVSDISQVQLPSVPVTATPAQHVAPATPLLSTPQQAAFVAGVVPEAKASASSTAKSRGCKARRAGASRCKSARRATSHGCFMTSKAARRSVGSKLQSERPVHVVAEPSFDASRIRTKVQLGLRSAAQANSAKVHESKVSTTVLASSRSARVGEERGLRSQQKLKITS